MIDTKARPYELPTATHVFPISDLHFDRPHGANGLWFPEFHPLNSTTSAIVAGDVAAMQWWRSKGAGEWIDAMVCSFSSVILIAGNNERFDDRNGRKNSTYLGSDGEANICEIRAVLAKHGHGRAVLLNDEWANIGMAAVFGCTLWTNFDGENGELMREDFLIESEDDRLLFPDAFNHPGDTPPREPGPSPRRKLFEHRRSLDIAGQMEKTGKTIFVSHHPPLFEGVAPEEKLRSDAAQSYLRRESSNIPHKLNEMGFELSIFGHSHYKFEKKSGKTLFVSNPFVTDQSDDRFDPFQRIPL